MSSKIHGSGKGQKELDRVLQSERFSHSESLRRLLRYLVEKSLEGAADDLKEFTVGIEALGKPDDYNPQIDPSVRVQVGRLRTKLEEYYQNEGKDNPSRITLPKRHFKIIFETGPQPADSSSLPSPVGVARLRIWQGIGITGVLAALFFAVLAFQRTTATEPVAASVGASFSGEQQAFWSPYLEGTRPTLLCISAPMFVWFEGSTGTFVRDPLINEWPLDSADEKFETLGNALRDVPQHPVHIYTEVGSVMGAFLIGKQFTAAGSDTTLIRSNRFSWDETKRTNVIYFGAPKNIPHLRDNQFQSYFKIVAEGVENLDPRPEEQTLYGRQALPNGRPKWTHAVIGRFRAKDEFGFVTALSSWDDNGIWAAAEYLSRPESMKELDKRLRSGQDEYPQSFEVLIRAEFQQEFPVNVTYVTHRVHPGSGS